MNLIPKLSALFQVALLSAASLTLISTGNAATTFEFRNTTSGAGFALDGLTTGSFDIGGLTITMTRLPDGVFNQTSSAFGINAISGSDDTDEFDVGEGFTFSFNQSVTITSISVSSFGSGNSGLLSINEGSTIGSVTSTGTTIIDSATISSGTLLRFESTVGAFSFDSIVVTAVPEPSTFALLGGLATLGFVVTRRRSRHV